MISDFDRALDECIDRMGRGESLEECLAHYPGYARQLGPLLRTVVKTKEVYPFAPAVDAKREARQRFFSAMEKQSRPTLWQRVSARRMVWATMASVLVIAGLLFVLQSTVFRTELPSITITEPADESIVDVNTVTIRGKTLAGAVVCINGDPVNVDSSGDFLLPVILEEGPNVFDIIASDQAGDQAASQLVVCFAP